MKKPDWLPDWFDLKNYDSVVHMDLLGWAEALQCRNYLISEQAIEQHETIADLVARLVRVSKSPDSSLSFWLDADGSIPLPVRYDLLDAQTVEPLTIGMLGAIWGDITSREGVAKFKHELQVGAIPKKPEFAEEYSKLELTTYDEFYLTEYPKDKDGREYNNNYMQAMGGFTFAKIDISAPDEQLIEDFKKWLIDIRNLIGISNQPQKFTAADMADWQAKQVLPYIDLTIWAKLTGISITQQEIGIVLFPDDYNINLSDRVRRTVKPLADKLMKPSAVGAICMQAGLPHY